MTDLPFQPGTVFFRPGDPADRAFLIRAGTVDVLHGLARVASLGPGDVFGEMSLIEERPHALTARAATVGACTALTRDEFEHRLLADPAGCRAYLKSLFERLRALSAEAARVNPQALAGSGPTSGVPVALPTGDPADPPAPVRVVVYPLTRRAAQTLPDDGLLVTKFPLRIGRAPGADDPEGMDLNDLWLLDGKPYNVSRNHCSLDLDGDAVVVRDRGSHGGCLVNDRRVGGSGRDRQAALHPGQNVLVLGGAMSPYQFRVEVGHVPAV